MTAVDSETTEIRPLRSWSLTTQALAGQRATIERGQVDTEGPSAAAARNLQGDIRAKRRPAR
jgi:hypothetical protein